MLCVVILAIRVSLHTRARRPARGIVVNLVHECTYPEDWNTLGDDRQIIIRLTGHGSYINEAAMSQQEIAATISKIMATRQEKMAWLLADDTSTYGDVVTNLSEVVDKTPGLAVLLPTSAQIKASEAPLTNAPSDGALPRPIEHCPTLPLATNP